ncbi:MAG: hypothetical protein JO317_05870 [Verrucomicrobiae bacterium]|nr:hypothetical protein [Verrucomicrobiae bacterium]
MSTSANTGIHERAGPPRLKLYGFLKLTKRQYLGCQLAGALWWLGLYGWWWHSWRKHSNDWVRHLDLFLFAAFLAGVVEMAVVLRKYKSAETSRAATTPETPPA